MAVHRVTLGDAVGAEIRAGLQYLVDRLAVVRLQILGDLAHHAERQTARHGGDRSARAAVIGVGAAAERTPNNHFVYESYPLADLLDHRFRDVVFIQIVRLVGEPVEAAELLHDDGDVQRHDAVGRGCHAFLDLVRLCDGVAAVAGARLEIGVHGCRVGRGRAIGQPAPGDVGVAGIARHRDLPAGFAEHLQRHRVSEYFALKFIYPPGC